MYIKVLLNGNDVLAMGDTGATHNFVAERIVPTRWVRIQARLRIVNSAAPTSAGYGLWCVHKEVIAQYDIEII